MGQIEREQKRMDVMLQVAREAVAPAHGGEILDRVPGAYREVLGELRALVAMSDLCRLAAIKRIQTLKAWCVDHRVSWEEVCDAALPKCRRTIDRYLDTLETFGDGTYEAIIELTTHAERVAARRLLKDGTIHQEGNSIVISGKQIPNDAAHTYQIVEVLREVFAQRDAATDEAAKTKATLKQQQEMARKSAEALIMARNAAVDETARIQALPAPREMGTEADRRRWNQLKSWQTETEHLLESFDGLIDEDDHSREFWGEAVTWLGWLQLRIHTLGLRLLGRRGAMVAELTRLGEPPRVALPQGEWPARTLEAQAEQLLQQDAAGRNSSGI